MKNTISNDKIIQCTKCGKKLTSNSLSHLCSVEIKHRPPIQITKEQEIKARAEFLSKEFTTDVLNTNTNPSTNELIGYLTGWIALQIAKLEYKEKGYIIKENNSCEDCRFKSVMTIACNRDENKGCDDFMYMWNFKEKSALEKAREWYNSIPDVCGLGDVPADEVKTLYNLYEQAIKELEEKI